MAIFSLISAFVLPGAGSLSLFGLSAQTTAAIFQIGRGVAWSLASAALTRPDVSSQQVQATISQTDAARRRAYGRNLLGGQKVFFEASGGELHQVVVMHHGRIDDVIRFWVDGEPVTLDGDNKVNRYTSIYWRSGSGQGGNYTAVPEPNLYSEFPTLWIEDVHKLQGQATFYTSFGDPSDEDFAKFYPKGPNTVVQAEVRASLVKNNAGDLIYSENAGHVIRDFMTHADGWNIPTASLDADSWDAFATLCAQNVPLAAGGSEDRYRICGYYTLDEALKDVTSRMLACCDGQIYETADGKIGILGGQWSEPDVTLTDADILSIEMQEGFDPFTTYNVLHGSYVSPAHGYQSTPVDPLEDAEALATQEERADQLDLPMCPSHAQLGRLMKIRMAKDRREWKGTLRTNLVGLKARWPKGDGLHTIRIQAEEFGIDGVFEVTSHTFSIPEQVCEIGIASIANPYSWTTGEEPDYPPTNEEIQTPTHTDPVPDGVVLVQEQRQVSGDVDAVVVNLSVDDPGREDLQLVAQIAKGNHAANGPWTDPQPRWVGMVASRLEAESGILDDGDQYTIRHKWRGYGDWNKAGPVTVVANPNQPAPPTALSVMVTGTDAYIDWTNGTSGYFRTQVLIGTTTVYDDATVIQTVSGNAGKPDNWTFDGSGLSGVRYFWVRTLNRSGVPSDETGPVSATF